VRAIFRKLVDDVRWLAGLWDRFWFTPSSPAALGWLRILAGLMLVYTHAVWSLRLEEFFGPRGFQDPELVSAYLADSTAWTFWFYVPEDWLWPVHWTCLGILGLFTIGFWTRLTSILSAIITISYLNRAPLANYGLDQINTLLVVYLAIGPSGATLSFDRWWTRFRAARTALRTGRQPVAPLVPATVTANVSLRLIEVHMAVLYFWAGLSKLKGYTWWDGTAIWLGAANYEYQSLSLTWLAWYPWVYNFLTHMTVLWELTFFLTVCHPRLRPYSLLAGASMHLGIGAFMGMWTFGLVMIFTYVSYMPATVAEAGQRWLAGALVGARRFVRYDPQGFWSRTRAILLATVDPDGRLWFATTGDELPTVPGHSVVSPLVRANAALTAGNRPSMDSTTLPLAPAAWWDRLRSEVGANWSLAGIPAPAQPDLSQNTRVLIAGGAVGAQVDISEQLGALGYRVKATPDAASAAVLMAVRPYHALILLVDHADEQNDLEFLRSLCETGGSGAPATVVVLSKPRFESFAGDARADHRVITAPFASADLESELALAFAARGWAIPSEPVLANESSS